MASYSPSLRHLVQEFLARPDYEPMRQHQLAKAMGLAADRRRELRHVLRELEQEGRVLRGRKNRWMLPDRGRLRTGTLRVHPAGFGFVTTAGTDAPDIYVGADDMGAALDGDTVQVRLAGRVRRRGTVEGAENREEGRISRVVRRARTTLVGLLVRDRHYAYVIPDDPRVPHSVRVAADDTAGEPTPGGHKVVIDLEPWNDPRTPLQGRIREDLGRADAPGVDMIGVLRAHGLTETFPPDVEQEAEDLAGLAARDNDEDGRRDLRELLLFTIDPPDAKDFDDAVSLERLGTGRWRLGVHIADVAHYVTPGSAVDREARLRGNSAYLVDRAVPMLPGRLTTEVCSLKPGEDRLTHTVLLELDDDGEVHAVETFPSRIRSAARLDYDQVQRFFDDAGRAGIPGPVADALTDMRPLARRLRRRRLDNGALALALPEVRCVLDEQGRTVDLYLRGAPEAYNLIEEFMLLANRAVADLMRRAERPALYRIHDEPDAQQWESMAEELDRVGVPTAPGDREDMLRILEDVAGDPAGYVVMRAVLTNLKRAVYSPTLRPHFGLAFDHYTHFTSPIRRYPDLVVHRALKALEEGAPPPHDYAEMEEIAGQCSGTERNAEEAEQESLDIKRVQFYARRLREGRTGPYPGVILAIRERGLWVEITSTLQRGLVPFAALTDDHYTVNADRSAAIGRRHRTVWRPGAAVQLELIRVDEARRLVDFRIVEGEAEGPPPRRRPGRRRKARK